MQSDDAAHDAVVHQGLEVNLALTGRPVSQCRGHHTVPLPALLQASRHHQGGATRKGQPRSHCDDVLALQSFGGLELDEPLLKPKAHTAGILEELARQGRFPGFDGVTHGGRRLAPPYERFGDAPMNEAESLRGLPESAPGAMVLDQRMQPPTVHCTATDRLEQSDQNGNRIDSKHRVALLQYFVDKPRIDPVEQPDVEQKLPLLRGQFLKQP